jgi:protein TonB
VPFSNSIGPASAPQIVRITKGVTAPHKTHDVPPVYPHIAILGHIQGTVEIECTIDTDGRVSAAQVVSGNPLLAPAALAAVQQWRYTPTLLNGVPVAVIMSVHVTFNLR